MAITAVLRRAHVLRIDDGSEEIGTATFSGTYTPGGFPVDCRTITGSLGTSPYGGMPTRLQFDSPLGYIYRSSFGTGANTQIATVKVFTAANTEQTAVALEATVPFVITRKKSAA